MEQPFKKITSGNDINWNHVYYFTKVAAYGSIKEAAKQLEIQSSTLSEHISQLEKNLKIKLFHRKHRQLILSQDGQRLYHHSKEMFEVGKRLLDVVSPLHLGDYPVSIGIVPNLCLLAAFDFAAAFAKELPRTDTHFRSYSQNELEKLIDDSKLDFGFSNNIPLNTSLDYVLIESRDIEFYVSAKLEAKTFEEYFEELPLIVYNSELQRGGFVEKLSESSDMHSVQIISTDYASQIIDLCERGIGIAMLSSLKLSVDSFRRIKPTKSFDLPKIHLYAFWSKNSEKTKAISTLFKIIEDSKQKS